jgi:hypothetical protein
MWRWAPRPSAKAKARRNPPHCQTLLILANHRILIVPSNPQPLPFRRSAPAPEESALLPKEEAAPIDIDPSFCGHSLGQKPTVRHSQPRSGARIQPTAQAGVAAGMWLQPEGAKETPGNQESYYPETPTDTSKSSPIFPSPSSNPPEQSPQTPPINHPDPQKQRRPPGRRLDRELTTAYYFFPLNISTTLS